MASQAYGDGGRGDGTKVSFESAVFLLRRKQYPFHYDPHPSITGIIFILLGLP